MESVHCLVFSHYIAGLWFFIYLNYFSSTCEFLKTCRIIKNKCHFHLMELIKVVLHTDMHTCTYMSTHMRVLTHTRHRGSPARRLGLGVAPAHWGGLGTGPCTPQRGFTASGARSPERDTDPPGPPALKEHRLPPAVVGPARSHLQSRQHASHACRG